MDILYLALLVAAAASMIASASVNSTFDKYNKQMSTTGMTGETAAKRILEMAGIHDVTVKPISGKLTDHYNPGSKQLCLSEAVYYSSSVAAIGVAAHECGHAIQHHTEYFPLRLRSLLVPVANIGSKLGVPVILLGLFFESFIFLADIGIIVFAASVLFHVVTLPVEFDASARAIELTQSYGILQGEEGKSCKKVLKSAAMTYVASAAVSVIQLLRLMALRGRRR